MDADVREVLSDHGIVSHTSLLKTSAAETARVQQALLEHKRPKSMQSLQQRLQFVQPAAHGLFADTARSGGVARGADVSSGEDGVVERMAIALANKHGMALKDFAHYVVNCSCAERQQMATEYHSQYVRAPPPTVRIGCDEVFAYGDVTRRHRNLVVLCALTSILHMGERLCLKHT